MTLMIELTPELEDRLKEEAARRGMSVGQYAISVLRANLPQAESGQEPTLEEIFRTWSEEDATNDPEEIARRQKEWEDFARGLDRNRVEAGARRLFPWLEL